MDRDELLAYLDEFLGVEDCPDESLNGLQVEGKNRVSRVATAVSTSARFFADAAGWGADAVLVHHGLFWRGQVEPVRGSLRQRLGILLAEDLNLFAYHLPLDRHPQVGNAAVLARKLGLEGLEPFGTFHGLTVGFAGVFPRPLSLEELARHLELLTGQETLIFPGRGERVTSVGIVTGSGAGAFAEAVETGLDALVIGDPKEWVMHRAEEEGIHVLACGHYASERFGVQALGEHLAATFSLEVRFFDYPNPA
ncbi:MAG: Nif3-like dinuclear metal center hexameric protein [Thermoanaerobaculum sp.]